MSIHQLRALIAVADTRSFRAAAAQLHRTQAAISQQIGALEARYGGPLFDRSTRPARLTTRGAALVGHARQVVVDYDGLAARLDADAGLSGPIRIGVIPTASIRLLPPLVGALATRHPDVRLGIESGLSDELQGRLLSGAIDAALVTRAGPVPDALIAMPVLTEPMVLARAGGADQAPRIGDVADLPFIRFRRSAGVGRIIDGYLTAQGIVPSDAVELDSIEAIVAVVANGLGITIVPRDDAERYGGDTLRTTALDLTRTIQLIARAPDRGLLDRLGGLLADG